MEIVTIDRAKDFIERVGWTFIQAFGGLLILDLIKDGIGIDWREALYASLIAGLIAAGKVIVAQRMGKHSDGAAIPGGVIHVKRTIS